MNDSALNTKFVEEKNASVIAAALVHSFFNTSAPLLSGIFFAAFTAGVTAVKSGLPILWVATVGLALTGAVRYYTVATYINQPQPFSESELTLWRFRYKFGALVQAAALGSWVFLAVVLTDDPVIHLIAVSITTGLIAAGAGRAYGQQEVYRYQAILAFVPQAVALGLKFTLYYAVLSFETVAFIIVLGKISANLHSIYMQAMSSKERANIYFTQLYAAISNILLGLCTFSRHGRLVVLNPRFKNMAGLRDDIIHTDPTIDDICKDCTDTGFISSEDAKTIQVAACTANPATIITTSPDSENPRALSWTIQRMPDEGVVVLVEDITERRAAEAKIAHMATHDGLTDLPNRIGFQGTVEPLLRQDSDQLSALLYIDLDHFKQVNDTLGHPVGDKLLMAVAGRLRQSIREQDIAARFGGDEFAVFLPGIETPEDAAAVAARIVATVGSHYDIDGSPIEIGASIGIALTRPFACYKTLLINADYALYEAKGQGRGVYRFFAPEMAARAEARQVLEQNFKTALDKSELELHFQPVVNLRSRKIAACEALLRWQHSARGLITPVEILKIAEDTKKMPDLCRWILNEACGECAQWPDDVAVAVNMSPRQLKMPDVLVDIRMALEASGLSPRRLCIEITEGALMENDAGTHNLLAALRALGISVSLDDFGTGYSSLSYLHTFPFQTVKIDRTFLDGIDKGRALTVLRSIAQLVTELGMAVVVEGIETCEQLELVMANSTIGEGQGYLFSHPVPGAEIRNLLSASQLSGLDILKVVGDAPPLGALAIDTAPMTSQEALSHITRLGITLHDLAHMIGVTLATVRRWIDGTAPDIPRAVQILLRLLTPATAQHLSTAAN